MSSNVLSSCEIISPPSPHLLTHFTGEEDEAKRGCMTCPRFSLGIKLRLEMKPRFCRSQAPAYLIHMFPSYDGPRAQQTGCLHRWAPEKGTEAAQLFLVFPFSWTPLWLLFLFFSYSYHSIGSLWKCFFGNVTVKFCILPYKKMVIGLRSLHLSHRRCSKNVIFTL